MPGSKNRRSYNRVQSSEFKLCVFAKQKPVTSFAFGETRHLNSEL